MNILFGLLNCVNIEIRCSTFKMKISVYLNCQHDYDSSCNEKYSNSQVVILISSHYSQVNPINK